jgi:hypothetical protein
MTTNNTVLISKERLQYLEYIEKNLQYIIDNAVQDIILNETRIKKNKKDYNKKHITKQIENIII